MLPASGRRCRDRSFANRVAGGILIRARLRARERENRSRKPQRVRKVVNAFNLGRRARVRHLHDQDRAIDELRSTRKRNVENVGKPR
jgi:hypothetical protein